MNYANTSTAKDQDARSALVDIYGYSNSAVLDFYDYDKIANEIKTANHPVYISGFGTKYKQRRFHIFWKTEYAEGHAYVIDGYREVTKNYYNLCTEEYFYRTTKFMHYNFGDEEKYNEWFSTNISDVDGKYIDFDIITGKEFPNFKYNKQCIYNIKP